MTTSPIPTIVDFKTRNSTFTDMATYRMGYVGHEFRRQCREVVGVRGIRQLLRHAGRAATGWPILPCER